MWALVDGPFVYRLGHKIFILERRVRLSYGLHLECHAFSVVLAVRLVFRSGPEAYPTAATAVFKKLPSGVAKFAVEGGRERRSKREGQREKIKEVYDYIATRHHHSMMRKAGNK